MLNRNHSPEIIKAAEPNKLHDKQYDMFKAL